MITKLENGRIYDPINKINGKIKDLFIKKVAGVKLIL